MFEPVHGSAPNIAGQGIANPIGQIWSGAMMLEHLGYAEAAETIIHAIARVLRETSVRTPDLGGTAKTEQVTAAVVEALRESSRDGITSSPRRPRTEHSY